MAFLKNLLVTLLASPVLGSLVRHGLTALSGLLLSVAIVTPEQAQAFVDANVPVLAGVAGYIINHWLLSAAVLYSAGQGASFVEKKKAKQRLEWR